MTGTERFRRVEDLYHAALERKEGDRKAFLVSECAGDDALLREVKSLLGYEAQAARFIEEPAAEAAARGLGPGSDESAPREPRLRAGMQLDSYEIVAPIDAGGMGEVYRARDSRLDREVAVKVLHGDVTAPDRVKRFEREARAAGGLNHPNVLTVHDVGTHDGAPYLVTELLSGRTLRDRLLAGPLPPRKAVEIAVQLARGLSAAHEKGIVHRDLKPANVFLTEDGRTKILDFGLAQLTAPAIGLETETRTEPERLTASGTLLGTIAYMSPEQARQQPVDSRSDVFSLGSVLYEMLGARRPFVGATAADTLSAILHKDPPAIETGDRPVPASLERIVRRCLEKEPAERFQSARDIAFALEALEALSETSGATFEATVPERQRRGPLVAALVIALAVAAGALGLLAASLLGRGRAAEGGPSQRTSVLPPPGVSFSPFNFALSPDAARLAFVGVGPEGQSTLWVRSLDARIALELKETLNAESPFWSPDSRRIGFFADGRLKVVDTSSGTVQVLCDAPAGPGGTWNQAGTIVFGNVAGPLLSVSDRGGATKPVSSIDPETRNAHRWPSFLPDGRHFLFLQDWGRPGGPRPNGIYAGSLDGEEPKLVSPDISGSVFFASGHLLYVQEGSLKAQPFDPARLELSGPAITVLNREVERHEAFQQANLSVSANGVAIFQSLSDAASEMVWFDRSGREVGGTVGAGLSDPQEFSPDGRYLAATSDDGRNGQTTIRILDLARGVSTPLTGGGQEMMPAWSPDGVRIAYRSGTWPKYALVQSLADASGKTEVLLEGPKMLPNAYTPDGRQLLYMRLDKGMSGMALFDLAQGMSEDMFPGAEFQFSPDGKWLAGIYILRGGLLCVQPFLGPGPPVPVSGERAGQPRWSRDGRRLFFVAPDRRMMEVELDQRGGRLLPGVPHVLFQTRIVAWTFAFFQYAVTADGTRFLINSLKPQAPLTLVTNWPRALSAK